MIPEIWKVFLFEWHRSLTVGRILTWSVLLLVPVSLMGAVLFLTRSEIPSTFLYVATYILVPQVICMLGLLLWATPAIHSELEAKTWVYLAMRPAGKQAILLGKYLVAVAWAFSASATAAILIAGMAAFVSVRGDEVANHWVFAFAMIALSLLSSLCYGALYLLIGVVVIKRAMVTALSYSLVVEYAISYIPATINQFTISYRLRGLLLHWLPLDIGDRERLQQLFGTESVSIQLLWIAGLTVGFLAVASLLLGFREIPLETET